MRLTFSDRGRGWGLVAALLLLATVGCGRKTGSISGKVSYNGKPLPSGSVAIYGEAGGVASSQIEGDGSYTIQRAPLGPAKLTVVTPRPHAQPRRSGRDRAPSKGPGGEQRAAAPEPKPVAIPEKYQDPQQSGLTYTVKPGDQTFDIDLKR
jgi:hypothetical protein